jgi:ribosomal protein S18 acetylase RimI-like enzyme
MPRADLLSIRELTADDIDACAELVEKTPLFAPYGYGRKEAVKDLEAAFAEPPGRLTMLAAEHEGSLVGFARFVIKGGFDRCGYLRLIVVDPDHTSGGVGQRLMEELEVRHLAPAGIILLCADDNVGAQRFYERLGYAHVGLLADYVKTGLAERIYFKLPPR